MSPAQAAKAADVSRRTIMRAIDAHELQARRDNKNHWKIAPEDLDRWADAQCALSERAQPDLPSVPTPMPTSDALELAAAKAENGQLHERLADAGKRIADLEHERDAWRKQAERSWFDRLFGRS